jgi:hypothetical protein
MQHTYTSDREEWEVVKAVLKAIGEFLHPLASGTPAAHHRVKSCVRILT